MKRIFTAVLIMSILSIAVLSCISKEKKNNTDNMKKEKESVSNQYDNNYSPGAEWKLAWSDEFEKDTIDTNNWNFQVVEAGRFNDEWQRYTNSSDNAYIDNNCLVIKAIHESDIHMMDQYTSARLHTANKHSWKYGKIVARIKLPQGKGIWPAFWMLGANINENGGDTPWPQSGESKLQRRQDSQRRPHSASSVLAVGDGTRPSRDQGAAGAARGPSHQKARPEFPR